jgi:hypothetical protein
MDMNYIHEVGLYRVILALSHWKVVSPGSGVERVIRRPDSGLNWLRVPFVGAILCQSNKVVRMAFSIGRNRSYCRSIRILDQHLIASVHQCGVEYDRVAHEPCDDELIVIKLICE